jgi:hypothetical protein
VFAKAVACINVDILYDKMDHNNRKIFCPSLFTDIPGQTDSRLLVRFSNLGLSGSTVLRWASRVEK